MKMNNSRTIKLVVSGCLLFGGSLFGQKVNETSAAIEYKKFASAMNSGDTESAINQLKKAKEYIDLAAANEETSNSPKTLYYKGDIYMGFYKLNTPDVPQEDALKIALEAYKKGYTSSDKFKKDILESVFSHKQSIDKKSFKFYEDSLYKESSKSYFTSYLLSQSVNQIDTTALYYSAVTANTAKMTEIAADRFTTCAKLGYKNPNTIILASQALRELKKYSEAKELVVEGRKKYPSDRSLLLELVNASIETGDTEGAEKSLVEALEADPSNKQLYYVIGTIYMELKKADKAESALNKAIELDPNYDDALYQLGAHLLTEASAVKEEASRLKFGDPKYDAMISKSDEIYRKALVPLEKYIARIPNDKSVLTILFQIHKSLKNTEKALEYKKRADAIN